MPPQIVQITSSIFFQITSAKISKRLAEAELTESQISAAREKYRTVAARGDTSDECVCCDVYGVVKDSLSMVVRVCDVFCRGNDGRRGSNVPVLPQILQSGANNMHACLTIVMSRLAVSLSPVV